MCSSKGAMTYSKVTCAEGVGLGEGLARRGSEHLCNMLSVLVVLMQAPWSLCFLRQDC